MRLLRQIEAEHRPANRDEQAVLAKWVGWGGLRQAFVREGGEINKGWEKETAELKDLLTPEEYRAAEASTRNAHYTSAQVVSAVWDIVKRLGFAGGQVLEPSIGAGNFIGLMPGQWRDAARVTGVELDHITGGIAKNLYPKADINTPVGFQDFATPNGHFDLAIGNPPFGSERLYDADRRELNKFSIHNYFFAKSIDSLRPGGVLAMVVTNYFMDADKADARAYLAARADLLGAIRLPNDAFLENAGTEVTTDIIVLQKRPEGTPAADLSWVDSTTFRDKNGKELPLNRYFKKHPEMMLGEFGAFGTMYRGNQAALVSRPDDDLVQLLKDATLRLPERVMPAPGQISIEKVTVPSTVDTASIGSAFLSPEGEVYVRKPDSLGKPQAEALTFPSDTAKERVAGMIRVRDAFARLRKAQIDEDVSDKQIDELRDRLNKVYDAFARKHGPINLDVNKRLFRDDPTWPQISALEEGFDKGVSAAVSKTTGEAARAPSAKKAPIFTKRTQQPYKRPTSASSAKDALAAVLADLGRVDLEAMSRLYGKSEAQIVSELGPLLWKTPSGAYETADAYLSGNVKQKLAEAQRAAQTDSDFRRNVQALQAVIPADIEAVDINVKPGSPWLPANHVAKFIEHITEKPGAKAFFSKANAKWAITAPAPTPAADAQWSTDRTTVAGVLEAVLNGQTMSVYDRDSDGKTHLNQPATDAANEKAEKVKAEWKRWLWADDARRDELARLYNDIFNTDVLRKFDGSHLSLPGKVSDDIISLRPHQKAFVWRNLQSSTALADHVVGAGKTFALIASIMEKRRTGQAKKPMLAVPNHLVGQWAADFVKLYPGAKVLATTKKDFEAANRKRLFARIVTGDWDVIIVAHSSFGKIGVSPEFEKAFIDNQVADLEASMTALRAETGEKSRNVAQLSKWRENLNAKLQRLLDAGGKDDGLTFDELGIDDLSVDEAHEFKNLAFPTSMTRVAGLGNPLGSQKAADLFMKIQSIMQRTGGRGVTFATGTPLSNTMAEMYTVQRYLDPKGLEQLGVQHFDAWARVFGEVVTDWELSPSGQYKLKSRFAKFVNMPELMKRYLSFADVITNDDIKAQLAAIGKKLPLPKVKGGKPTNVVVERSPYQAAYIGEGKPDEHGNLVFPQGSLVWRAENLPKKVEKGADNMLKVMSDARKAALDMRLIDPSYPDVPGSKVHIAADNMKRLYDQWDSKKGTQLVFIDLSTPKKAQAKEQQRIRDLMKKASEGDEAAQEAVDNMSPDEFLALDSSFSVYDDLRQKLIDRGIPAGEVAFIHDANTDVQKEELFGKVRSGRVRLLFGSTAKMGAGTNVQNRLIALHHLDAPWRPSDLEQRDGRGIRQGNELYAEDPDGFELEINRYATKNTLDARQWQTIEGKARFIGQVRKGGSSSREIEDIAGEASNAAEMKAAASGNPLILEEMDLRQRLRRLTDQSVEHDREQHRIRGRISSMRAEIQRNTDQMPTAQADAESAQAFAKADFAATIEGKGFDKPGQMGAAIIAAGRRIDADKVESTVLGKIGAFSLSLQHQYTHAYTIEIEGKDTYDVFLDNVNEADPVGTGQRVVNTIRKLVDKPEQLEERNAELASQIPALEKQLGPWADADKLAETAKRHQEVLAELRPKQKPAATVAPAGAEPSIDEEPAFQRWFRNSKVTNEDGSPQIVYHNGHKDIAAFDRMASAKRFDLSFNNLGIWFSSRPDKDGGAGMYGPKQVAAYLSMQRPFIIHGHESRELALSGGQDAAWRKFWKLYSKLTDENSSPPVSKSGFAVREPQRTARRDPEPMRQWLKANGYDGLILRNTFADSPRGATAPQDMFIVLEPEQIKSVDNQGTFDPEDARIHYSASEALPAPRRVGLPSEFRAISAFKNDTYIKVDPNYLAAKGGDPAAAARLVPALVNDQMLERVRAAFGKDVVFVAPFAEEASGPNAIPAALSHYLAARIGADVDSSIIQVSRAYHTGARPLDRLLGRAIFDGPVQPGRKYVLVDDVTVLGGTLAELADYIRTHGGEVVGATTLVNASRSGIRGAPKQHVRLVEERYGDVIRQEFGIEPSALTGDEALVVLGYRNADALRTGIAAAKVDREQRLLQKGIRRPEGRESQVSPAGWDVAGEMDQPTLSEADKQEIRDIVQRVSGLDSVTFTSRIELPNGAPGWGNSAPTTAGGYYDPAADAITIAENTGGPRTAYHEAFHRLQRLFATDHERKVLLAEVGRLRRIVGATLGRESHASRMSQKELEAEAFAIYSAGQSKIAPHKAVAGLWDRLARLARQTRNLLAGRGFQTSEDIFDRARSGEMAGRNAVAQPGGRPELQTAYHGTPHAFDRFSTANIGTGEGFQSFGWGLYFASRKDVADIYRQQLARDGGQVMKVDVPEDSELMLWDKPLDQQPPAVQRALRSMVDVVKKPGFFSREPEKTFRRIVREVLAGKDWHTVTGGELYGMLARRLGNGEANQRAASKALLEAGIPGHRYLDAGSRAAGKGSYNYVVYDDGRISVLDSEISLPTKSHFEENEDGFQYSVAPEVGGPLRNRVNAVTENRIVDEIRGRLTDLMPSALAAIPLNYFPELARRNMTAVGEYLRVKRILDAYRGKKHAAADAIAQEWLKYARLGLGAGGKAKAAILAELMHDTTLAGIDPSRTDEETTTQNGYDALRKRFMALSPAGRSLYVKVRDAYVAQADELDKILLDNVRKAQEIARRRAEDAYNTEAERIKAARLEPMAKADALKEASDTYAAASTKAAWAAKARLTKMRIAFENSRVPAPYFPLARFGRYFVTVRDDDGSVLSFSRRERARDRDVLAADMRNAFPGKKVEVGVVENVNEMKQAMDPRLVAEIEEIVGGAGFDAATLGTVMDQIWQRYLETMPDLSVRKRFIHRKGVEGFDSDALRAFSSHMFHAGHQMGRLKYGLELQELTNEASDQARKSDDPTRGMTLANELRLRHKWVMNPTGSSVAQVMSSAAFVWYLGATPAAAIVNMSQTPMIGIPVLAGRFGSFAKASAAVLKAAYDSAVGKGSVTRANLSAEEKAALEHFYESGLIDRTQSHDLAGVGDTGVRYSPLKSKVMQVISWAFHRTEVWNREVTALAAFRLAKAAGENFSDAVDSAHDLTWKTHFDYSNSSRPRLMQNDFAKVALVFRAYNINMLYRVFRDIHQAMKGETPQARREARYQAAGVVGMMTLMGGVSGVIGFNLMMMLASALLGDDDDPMDFEQQFRKDVVDILGPQLGGVVLNGAPGYYTGLDLTSRVGMPDLWFRSPSKDLQGKDEFDYWVMNSLGASVSMLGQAYQGFSLIGEGKTERGVETLAPKWIRDLMKSYRYLNEGVTNLKGDEILPASQVDGWDAIAQAIGFTPAEVAETYDRNSALQNAESRVNRQRTQLINQFALAARMGDEDGRAEALDKIKEFNRVPLHRSMPITVDTLQQSLKVRARNDKKREDGVLIENQRLGKQLRDMLPTRLY